MEKIEAILCDNDRGIIITHGSRDAVYQKYIALFKVYEMNHLPNSLEYICLKDWLKDFCSDKTLTSISENIVCLSYKYQAFFGNFKKLIDEGLVNDAWKLFMEYDSIMKEYIFMRFATRVKS